MKKWTNESSKKLWKICLPIIILCIVIGIAAKSIGEIEAEGDYTIAVHQNLKPYGDVITDIYIDNGYVGLYIDAKRWNATSEETQKQFLNEVYVLVRMAAITSKITKYHSCLLGVYDSNFNKIALYDIKE